MKLLFEIFFISLEKFKKTGMIAAFGAVANLPPADKAKVLASSIAEALNATGFGLLVSIILFAAWGNLKLLLENYYP
jgi:biopolymer transport protein ExbB/TolQ